MKYLAVLGRQPKISLAELESLFENVRTLGTELAEFETKETPDIRRLGGSQKLAVEISGPVVEFLKTLPQDKKITLGVSDFSRGANAFGAQKEALKLKRIMVKLGYSVRVVPNKAATLSSATSFHNHLFDENKVELIKSGKKYYRVIGVQNIDAYVRRDQARPARDAKVGMLPPKLAQILINLCGDLPAGSRLLDPFCGTGVVLQEAALMGYMPYGTDLSERMVEYSRKNLGWLLSGNRHSSSQELRHNQRGAPKCSSARNDGPEQTCPEKSWDWSPERSCAQGDATSYQWQPPINAVACEGYLGQPMSLPPAEIKLKQEKQECGNIVLGFLKNLAEQIEPSTSVVIAVPAWLRPNGEYERLNLLDEIKNLGYNVKSFRNLGQKDLLYHREQQVVAREIIVLRKK